jgi:L-threonylcarbamoyladenylate synthase
LLLPEAIEALRRGAIVAFPTETYYALGASALDPAAVERVMRAKGREPDKPIAVIVADRAMLERVARVPAEAEPLLKHWPGPLVLVLPAVPGLPEPLLSARGEIGLRISSHPLARDLVTAVGAPLTATSANRAGEPPPRTAAGVREALGDVAVLDGGATPGGPPSTVIGFERGRPVIIRQGAFPWPR